MSPGEKAKSERRRDTRLRFEQWARNPLCTANGISAVHGVSMAEVAKREGLKPSFGQSPFAIARGQTFERSLFRNSGESLREALVASGVLPEGAQGFRDFRLTRNGGPYRNLDQALEATVEFLRAVGQARTKKEREALPALLAGPVVRIPGGIMLPEAILVIDVLVLRTDRERPEFIVGEIKTYPDRAGYTDPGELATGRAQAGVYVHGLRLVLADLQLGDRIVVSSEGFLVLTRPGFSRPSVRAGESLEYQARRAERGFERLREIAREMGGSPEPEVVIRRVLEADTSYCEACLSFCDRSPGCYRAALKRGDATVLGDEAPQFLGATGLYRALELLGGAEPSTAAEKDLSRRLQELRTKRLK